MFLNKPLYTYSSKVSLPVKGVFKCQIGIGKCNTETEFTVIQGRGEPLLSRKTAIELSVLRVTPNISTVTDVKSEIQRQYPKLFQGVGKLNTKQISLHIDESVVPVVQPLRRVPFHLREAVEKKIDQLLEIDIIERVEGPTPWVNPVVVAPKAAEDDIRMCLDMRRGNAAIIRGRYLILTVDELLQGMNGSVAFSKLDLKWGYHQLELTPKSIGITTFAVHTGTFRYKRLIFGFSLASEQYQHEIAMALAGWHRGGREYFRRHNRSCPRPGDPRSTTPCSSEEAGELWTDPK